MCGLSQSQLTSGIAGSIAVCTNLNVYVVNKFAPQGGELQRRAGGARAFLAPATLVHRPKYRLDCCWCWWQHRNFPSASNQRPGFGRIRRRRLVLDLRPHLRELSTADSVLSRPPIERTTRRQFLGRIYHQRSDENLSHF